MRCPERMPWPCHMVGQAPCLMTGPNDWALRRDQAFRDDDVALLDLAGRALGQRVGDPHVARVLVRRDLALDVVAQFLGGDDGTRLEGYRGADLLAQGR